jgi:DNA-binding NtrC family response regulator
MSDIADITVLYVDDEADALSALKSCLRREPYKTAFAASGEEALALLEASSSNVRASVVVSDIHMPGMSGIELIQQVNARFPEIVCMAVSGANNINQLVKSGNDIKIFSSITKPIDIPAFKKSINDAIDHYRNRINKQ